MHKELVQILGHFKIDWKVLQAVMLTMGAIISGSAALAVLQPGEFVLQDLDIYITSKNLAMLIIFLNDSRAMVCRYQCLVGNVTGNPGVSQRNPYPYP